MDAQKAEQIASSGQIKRITHNGKAVYIQRVDKENDTARIFHLEEPDEEFDVELSQLEEH